jgi:hypothetical protein
VKNLISFFSLLLVAFQVIGQAPAHIDRKTKEFIITPNTKASYSIIGYQYPNLTTKKMICFSTNSNEVRESDNDCPLGAYFDTNHLKEGDMIFYLGAVGGFGKMNFIRGNGKKTVFYILKTSYTIK